MNAGRNRAMTSNPCHILVASYYRDRVVRHLARMQNFLYVKLFLTVIHISSFKQSLLEIEVKFFFLLMTSVDLDITIFNA